MSRKSTKEIVREGYRPYPGANYPLNKVSQAPPEAWKETVQDWPSSLINTVEAINRIPPEYAKYDIEVIYKPGPWYLQHPVLDDPEMLALVRAVCDLLFLSENPETFTKITQAVNAFPSSDTSRLSKMPRGADWTNTIVLRTTEWQRVFDAEEFTDRDRIAATSNWWDTWRNESRKLVAMNPIDRYKYIEQLKRNPKMEDALAQLLIDLGSLSEETLQGLVKASNFNEAIGNKRGDHNARLFLTEPGTINSRRQYFYHAAGERTFTHVQTSAKLFEDLAKNNLVPRNRFISVSNELAFRCIEPLQGYSLINIPSSYLATSESWTNISRLIAQLSMNLYEHGVEQTSSLLTSTIYLPEENICKMGGFDTIEHPEEKTELKWYVWEWADTMAALMIGESLFLTLESLHDQGKLSKYMPNSWKEFLVKHTKQPYNFDNYMEFAEEPFRNLLAEQGKLSIIPPQLLELVIRNLNEEKSQVSFDQILNLK